MLTSAMCLLFGSTNIKPKPLANTTPASAKSLDTIPMVEKHRIILPTATLLFQFSGLQILIYSQQNSIDNADICNVSDSLSINTLISKYTETSPIRKISSRIDQSSLYLLGKQAFTLEELVNKPSVN